MLVSCIGSLKQSTAVKNVLQQERELSAWLCFPIKHTVGSLGGKGSSPVFNSRSKRDWFYLPFRALAVLSIPLKGWKVADFQNGIKTNKEV